MSKLESQWSVKSEEEIEQALRELDLYNPEAQRVIKAESQRRQNLQPPERQEDDRVGVKSDAKLRRDRMIGWSLLVVIIIFVFYAGVVVWSNSAISWESIGKSVAGVVGALVTGVFWALLHPTGTKRKMRRSIDPTRNSPDEYPVDSNGTGVSTRGRSGGGGAVIDKVPPQLPERAGLKNGHADPWGRAGLVVAVVAALGALALVFFTVIHDREVERSMKEASEQLLATQEAHKALDNMGKGTLNPDQANRQLRRQLVLTMGQSTPGTHVSLEGPDETILRIETPIAGLDFEKAFFTTTAGRLFPAMKAEGFTAITFANGLGYERTTKLSSVEPKARRK
jgi:hypothetical protein